jgi:hypothetical protein
VGFDFENHNNSNNWGDLSQSFNFDDSILTSGSVESTGSMTARQQRTGHALDFYAGNWNRAFDGG